MEKTSFCMFFLLIVWIFLSGCAKKEEAVHKTITIAAVGDVNFGFDCFTEDTFSGKGNDFFKYSKEILQATDLSFCNLETVLCNKGYPAKNADGKNTFIFRASPKLVDVLVDAGFDVVSIANNHIRDFGIYGENETKKALVKSGLQFVSRDGEIASFKVKGVDICFVGFSSGYERRSISNYNIVFEEIKNLAEQYDILIVSFHAGAEGEGALHVKNKNEFFLGENRGNVIMLAHAVIDNGADLVLMHGPHVPRAVEIYRDRFVAYSLGNFVNYDWSLKENAKIAPLLWIELLPSGKPLQVKIYSFIQKRPGYPEFDKKKMAYKLIKNLTKEDIKHVSFFFNKEN